MKVSQLIAAIVTLFCLAVILITTATSSADGVLQPQHSGLIIGSVADAITGVPLEYAEIEVQLRVIDRSPDGTPSLRRIDQSIPLGVSSLTDSHGRFKLTVPLDESGYFLVVARVEGYREMWNVLVQVKPNEVTSIRFEMVKNNLTTEESEIINEKHERQKLELYEQNPSFIQEPPLIEDSERLVAQPSIEAAYTVPDQVYVSNLQGYTGLMNFDDFVAGTVSAEMGEGFPFEALKAQAVAARSYALERYNRAGIANGGQAYTSTLGTKSRNAAINTNKIILLYNGNVIAAYYSARCNGNSTLDSEVGVWAPSSCTVGGNVVPYARSRACSGHAKCNQSGTSCYPSGGESPCCTVNAGGRQVAIYGHGVGMCQRGAQQFAGRDGKDWQQILLGFFTGVTIANTPGLAVGDQIRTTGNLNTRNSACGSLISTIPSGTNGTIIAGPQRPSCSLDSCNYLTWWRVQYSNGVTGWSFEDALQKVGSNPQPSPSPSPSVSPIASPSPSPSQCGTPPVSFYLSFPLPNRTAFNALINSVFDHSMTASYAANNTVTAFTGEVGQSQYGSLIGNSALGLYGFKNNPAVNFIVNGNYAGAGNPDYLFYDGHPGIDYRTTDQASNGRINVYAAAPGTAHHVASSCCNTIYIDHVNGYSTHYLHLSQRIATDGAQVARGQLIGVSGDVGATGSPHLHFEVKKNGVQVDPYGWQGQFTDPRGAGSNTNLWKPRAYASCNVRWHPDGTLITQNGSEVYLVEGGKKRGIPTTAVFYAYGYDFANVINISAEEFTCLANGPNLASPPPSRLRNVNNTIYEVTDRNFKRAFPSAMIFQGQGFRWTDIQSGSVSGIADDPNIPVYNAPFRDGTLVQASGSQNVYVISNSTKRLLDSSSTLISLGYRFEDVLVTSAALINGIPAGPSITGSTILQCSGSSPSPSPTPPVVRTLTVASSNPNNGVSITVSPSDNNGAGNGNTQFTRTYNNNTSVSLTAPSTANGNNFQKWQRNGADWSTNRATSVTMDASHTMTAVYIIPGGGGTVSYDSVLKAPRCAQVGSICDSGALLNGRDGITGGAEPNQPNTIYTSCPDNTVGTYHIDESIDRIRISTLDGSNLAAGKAIRIEVTVWAFATDRDYLDLFYASDATNPNWQFIATLTPNATGLQVLSTTFTFPAGTNLQAIRANFSYDGPLSPCAGDGDDFDDHDDLVFAMGSSSGQPFQLALEQFGPAANQALALDATLMLRDPFPVLNNWDVLNGTSDKSTRVVVFLSGFQLAPGETSSSVVVNLIDSLGQSFDVAAQDVRGVPNSPFTQVTFRLPTNLAIGTCTISAKARGQTSNSGTIRIRD
ncbi:MAG TPA: peptidoglycan DD-metalloendopeptidase family protein [Pyrinomonadaceae bacterium]